MFFNADDSIILFVKEKIIQNVSEAAKNQRIAVGVSGGVDSMVLLRALIEAKKSTDFSFFIVNIEHGIRGRSSENDSRFVADFARSHGIECRTFKVDSLRRAKEFGETEEEAARVLRYGVFQKLLIDGDCDKVFLAHHEDDQAETVLMRIIRGTGIKGLSGMQKETRGYVRPLLDVSKEEILDFQKKYDVPYVVDESNFENDKTRNLIRNEIMPLLNRAGDATGSLNRLSRIAADTEEFLSTLDLPLEISKDSVGIDVKNPPVFLLKRAIRNAFLALGVEKDVEEKHVLIILDLLQKENGASVDMPYGVVVTKEYDKIVFSKSKQKQAFTTPFATGKVAFLDKTVIIDKTAKSKDGVKTLTFDLSKIPAGAVMRTREDGDVFTKFSGGTKKLGDYFTDKKIPKRERDEIPLVAIGKDVLIVVGTEISDKVKINENTKPEYIFEITSEDN